MPDQWPHYFSQTRDKDPDILRQIEDTCSNFQQKIKSLETAYLRLQERLIAVNAEAEKTKNDLLQKIAKNNAYMSSLLKHSDTGIIFIEPDGFVSLVNEKAATILQTEKNKLLFKNFSDIFPDEFFGFSIKNALRFDFCIKTSYATLANNREIKISPFPINDNFTNQGLLIFLADTTQNKKIQQESNQNERLKNIGEMTTSIVHDIKNPLGAIRGYASLLNHDLSDQPHLKEMTQHILEGLKLIERLSNIILQYVKPVELKLIGIELSSFLKEICFFIKHDPSFPNHVELKTHLIENEIFTLADKELLKTALLNIIINAFQAIEKEGIITIAVLQNNNNCLISISDTGKGIEPSHMSKIFLPFFTTKKEGNGLGLSETLKIIKAHGGFITVNSKINGGTTFNVTLPLKR
jgi:signal transduction histidine kinase